MHNIVLGVIWYTIGILYWAGNFGDVSTYCISAYVYYIVKFVSSPYITQYENIIDGQIKNSSERFINETYLTKMGLRPKWYRQTYGNDVIITLCIIVYPKLKSFVTNCVDYVLGNYV